jgi:hypothetical protein
MSLRRVETKIEPKLETKIEPKLETKQVEQKTSSWKKCWLLKK